MSSARLYFALVTSWITDPSRQVLEMSYRRTRDSQQMTDYCSELYNYESYVDNTALDCSQHPEENLQPILREEVEITVAALKKGNSAGVDNIPAELVQAGGESMIDVLTKICDKIWKTGEWPSRWAQSLIITVPKKGNLQLCQNYRTISLISHTSKDMLRVIVMYKTIFVININIYMCLQHSNVL